MAHVGAEAVQLARREIQKFGYDPKLDHLDAVVNVSKPEGIGDLVILRYWINWNVPDADRTKVVEGCSVDVNAGYFPLLCKRSHPRIATETWCSNHAGKLVPLSRPCRSVVLRASRTFKAQAPPAPKKTSPQDWAQGCQASTQKLQSNCLKNRPLKRQ